jgi:Ca2+-transporting ATPase
LDIRVKPLDVSLGNSARATRVDRASGLTAAEADARLARFGPNTLPEARATSLCSVFLRQFLSPLIYILLAAAFAALVMKDFEDALFIGIVLLLNGLIGTVQEYSAGRAATALRKLEQPLASVVRDGVHQEIDARKLVPGDLVLLEAGGRVPADLQLVESVDLQCDESLLTGESAPVKKAAAVPGGSSPVEPRHTAAFAGSMISRGRGRGIVLVTGAATEIGKIAKEVAKRSLSQPPLMIRLKRFSRAIAVRSVSRLPFWSSLACYAI